MAQTGGSRVESHPPPCKGEVLKMEQKTFCGKTPLTKVELEFLLYDDI
jgi:hypothetical protein